MKETATVCAKIDRDMKKEIERLGISPSEVIKKALDEAILEKKRQMAIDDLNEAGKLLKKLPEESWVKAVKESRDER